MLPSVFAFNSTASTRTLAAFSGIASTANSKLWKNSIKEYFSLASRPLSKLEKLNESLFDTSVPTTSYSISSLPKHETLNLCSRHPLSYKCKHWLHSNRQPFPRRCRLKMDTFLFSGAEACRSSGTDPVLKVLRMSGLRLHFRSGDVFDVNVVWRLVGQDGIVR